LSLSVLFNIYIYDILTEEEVEIIYNYYDDFYNELNFKDVHLIYFDHKLADQISTLTDFYLGLVPCSKNMEISKKFNDKLLKLYYHKIKNYDKFRLKHNYLYYDLNIKEANIYDSKYNEYYNDMVIIPVIKKCRNIIIVPMKPLCPIPPYKPYFKNLIKFLKNNKNIKTKSLSLTRKNRNIKPFLSL